MRPRIRAFFNVDGDPEVTKAREALDEQQQRLAQLQSEKAHLEKQVNENEILGEQYRAAVQARLNARADAAGPALDTYDSISVGKILYDQLTQLVSRIYEGVYSAAASDVQNYGYKSKQFFSASITGDALSRHLQRWDANPFDHLVEPLMGEMQDAGMDPSPVAPLLEFAHNGCSDRKHLSEAVLGLREHLSRHRASIGGAYASGKRVDWESMLDVFKFNVKNLSTDRGGRGGSSTASDDVTLMEQADRCAQRVEEATRKEQWQDCVAGVQQLWGILAPTLRGNAAVTDTTVPLLKAMFDIRDAAEQHIAAEYYRVFMEAQTMRMQAAFTMKLFEMKF